MGKRRHVLRERQQRRQRSSCRVAADSDALRIDAQRLGIAAEILDGGFAVERGLGYDYGLVLLTRRPDP